MTLVFASVQGCEGMCEHNDVTAPTINWPHDGPVEFAINQVRNIVLR